MVPVQAALHGSTLQPAQQPPVLHFLKQLYDCWINALCLLDVALCSGSRCGDFRDPLPRTFL